jgi:DNA anti-recombination protein RmuC
MKKNYLISTAVILALAWIAFGQEQSEWAQRWARYREAQGKAIAAIQEQAEKLKTAFEESAKRMASFRNWQDLSEDERAKLREEGAKRREEWGKMLEEIEQQVAMLKGRRQLSAEHEEAIAEFKKIQEMAEKENADETAKHIEELIAKRQEAFEETLRRLGLDQFGRRL